MEIAPPGFVPFAPVRAPVFDSKGPEAPRKTSGRICEAGGGVRLPAGQETPPPGRALPRAWIGLGGNQGAPRTTFRRALHMLERGAGEGAVRLEAVSNVVRTRALLAPGGGPQPDYLNAVAVARTRLEPRELLGLCLRIEAECGRRRVERWGARTLDLDLLFFEGRASDDPLLRLPHPEWERREFVLGPLLDPALDAPGARSGCSSLHVPPERKRLLHLLGRS